MSFNIALLLLYRCFARALAEWVDCAPLSGLKEDVINIS